MTPLDLRSRREALGLSQSDLARLLGVTQATISMWEGGTRSPRDPASIMVQLGELADVQAGLVERLVDWCESASAKLGGPMVRLRTYATDADYWADEPGMTERVPAAMHRVAAALAAGEVEAEFGIQVELYG